MFMNLKSCLAALVVTAAFASCDDKNKDFEDVYMEKTVTLSRGEVVPAAAATSGTATTKFTFNKSTSTLNYVVNYSGLNNNADSIIIRGIAVRGANPTAAALEQKQKVTAVAKTGTFSGSLVFDNVIFKREDLLAGRFFIQLTSKAGTSGPGTAELRGQIEF